MTIEQPPTPWTSATTSDGWVTMSHTHVPGIGRVAVQKRDGCTRSVPVG